MPILTQGVAFRLRQPTVRVENALEPGSWRFRLVVVDDSGLVSAPTELVVRVVELLRPPGPIVPPVAPRIRSPQPAPGPVRRTAPARPVRRANRARRPAP